MKNMVETLFLLIAIVHLTSAATHCLRYFYTGATPGINFTEYTAEGWLDGEQFVEYESKIRKLTPKTEWIKKGVPDNWESVRQNLQDEEKSFKDDVVKAMQSFNSADGVHTVKWMYGCELYDDGTERGYWQCGYDGEVFFSLRMKNGIFTAETPQSETAKLKWDEIIKAGFLKAYLQYECISFLQNFVDLKTPGSRKRRSNDENTVCWPGQEHEASGGGSNGIITGPVVAVLLLVLIVGCVGFFIWKKKTSGFKPVSGNPNASSEALLSPNNS